MTGKRGNGANLAWKDNRELTLAAIKYWELYYAIKEVGNGDEDKR